jgi:hypothetical protein
MVICLFSFQQFNEAITHGGCNQSTGDAYST